MPSELDEGLRRPQGRVLRAAVPGEGSGAAAGPLKDLVQDGETGGSRQRGARSCWSDGGPGSAGRPCLPPSSSLKMTSAHPSNRLSSGVPHLKWNLLNHLGTSKTHNKTEPELISLPSGLWAWAPPFTAQ